MSWLFFRNFRKMVHTSVRPTTGTVCTSLSARSHLQFGMRNFSEVSFTILTAENKRVQVKCQTGETLLTVCQDYSLDVEGACGGECCCSTCHVYIPSDLFSMIPDADEDEEDMLELAVHREDTSRLGCQIKVTTDFEGTEIQLPSETVNQMSDSE